MNSSRPRIPPPPIHWPRPLVQAKMPPIRVGRPVHSRAAHVQEALHKTVPAVQARPEVPAVPRAPIPPPPIPVWPGPPMAVAQAVKTPVSILPVSPARVAPFQASRPRVPRVVQASKITIKWPDQEPEIVYTSLKTREELESLYNKLLKAGLWHEALEISTDAALGNHRKPKLLTLSQEDILNAKKEAAKPGDITYSGTFTMHHKLPRHVLAHWFEKAVEESDVETLEKLAVLANRPGKSYLKKLGIQDGTEFYQVIDMQTFKSDATYPLWDLFEGPLSSNRGDDPHEQRDAHYTSEGAMTPRSRAAHQILDAGIKDIPIEELQKEMRILRRKSLNTVAKVNKSEWKNDIGEVWGQGKKYQWSDPKNDKVRANVEKAKKQREEENRKKASSKGLASFTKFFA